MLFFITIILIGNVYVTDRYNHRLRKVTIVTGIITTIAGTGNSGFNGDGGDVTSATLNLPMAVAIASSGNVYFTDGGNNRVRKVTLAGTYGPR